MITSGGRAGLRAVVAGWASAGRGLTVEGPDSPRFCLDSATHPPGLAGSLPFK